MSNELDELLLQNLSDLDGACIRLYKIDARVSDEICKTVEYWCEEQAWIGKFGDGENMWFAPPNWAIPSSRGPDADVWFQWMNGAGDDADYEAGDDYWDLTRMLKAGRGKSGFRLMQNRVGKKLFSDPLVSNAHGEGYEAFELDDNPSLFRAFLLDPAAIPEAMRVGDFADAMKPIVSALEDLKAVVPRIDAWLPPRKN